jgi:hypothetical protein
MEAGKLEWTVFDGARRLSVVQADPHILISDELLVDLVVGPLPPAEPHPDISLTRSMEMLVEHGCVTHAGEDHCGAPGPFCFKGAVLKFEFLEQDIIYLIDRYDFEQNAWWAHWPD